MMDDRSGRGAQFEARVASLLRSSPGYRDIREQQHIKGKDVDIIFRKQWNPHKYITIAVECKNWKRGVDRASVQSIYLDHKPLLDAKDIDELWIVTPHPVASTVQEYADSFDHLEVLHINEFEQDVIDFSIYTSHLIKRFSQDKLSQYYIPSRLEHSDVTLHERVMAWLESPSNKPIAVWAGYGMGKTSYATFLAAALAEQFNSDPANRIPILIPLGDFYTAPRLDGLFANVLTNEWGVHGYNFNTFWNLHEAGRFLIILDGFDEMKHAMTKAEFMAIAKEIRKLIIPNSKVILLGRPDAIVSDEEHALLVRGTRRVSDIEIPDTIDVEFTEFRLDFFSTNEYIEFLTNYLSAFCELKHKNEFIKKRLNEITTADLSDILKRPVQARMLAQVLLNPNNSIEKIAKFDLYDIFINECLSREAEKYERKKTDTQVRRRFMQDLAWWLWAIKRTRTFTITDIPAALAKPFVEAGEDHVGRLRELLVGSVVEERSVGSLVNEKSAGTYYFPHLSFTEFLVSEYLITREIQGTDVGILSNSFDGEIKSFLQSYNKADAMFKLYKDLKQFKSSLSWEFIEFLSGAPTLKAGIKTLVGKDVISIWQFAVEFLALMQNGRHEKAASKCVNVIASDQFRYTSVGVQLLVKQLLILKPASSKFSLVANSLLCSIFRGINVDKLAESVRASEVRYRTVSETDEYFVKLLGAVQIGFEGGVFGFSAGDMYGLTLEEAENNISIVEREVEFPAVPVEVQFSEVRRSLRTDHDRHRFDVWIKDKTRRKSVYVF